MIPSIGSLYPFRRIFVLSLYVDLPRVKVAGKSDEGRGIISFCDSSNLFVYEVSLSSDATLGCAVSDPLQRSLGNFKQHPRTAPPPGLPVMAGSPLLLASLS